MGIAALLLLTLLLAAAVYTIQTPILARLTATGDERQPFVIGDGRGGRPECADLVWGPVIPG